ncbi:MAG: tRNA preQ1(34) S-adenosylmethionine ribosyltransferase-isomerase QueA [Chloroflexi bacterium]|nr:tRNA preQ1(34) S-adenosylmethionine ribosyltransferase-isomerase QueA [Chloroflexota bacterium]MCL5110219.1 tRNA preQ1(34) S-adenosylmethionine ribosyltransferase-isomerase QueA [Chloroflexota bacterium]
MKTSDFAYELPEELIAQTPLEPRDSSRLLVLRRDAQSLEQRTFRDLPQYLRPGDLLVANDSRVVPARLYGRRAGSGGKVEALLLVPRGQNTWEALVRPGRRLLEGAVVEFGSGDTVVCAEVVGRTASGGRLLRFAGGDADRWERIGVTPLPPYIKAPLADPERYQTVYARERGSVAAPTAGLHFTPRLMGELAEMGIGFAFTTLHIGLDTFRPVASEEVEQHQIHSESCTLTAEAAAAVNAARAAGGRVVAVGTTAVRTLESAAAQAAPGDTVAPYSGWTNLFIYPGYQFRAVDCLVTNFHLPRSSLLMLVSAFAGREFVLRAYRRAVAERYRFYSFGDAMLIL